jgi:hypothetical protein
LSGVASTLDLRLFLNLALSLLFRVAVRAVAAFLAANQVSAVKAD